ncbi:hypothetical protein [Pseudodesulfovibrio karagichevae]|uniref:Uncharacterized protein n=1 Tax=Pseudodesulfovibrio karagichevae TaxID=3239305 RepID=A0ABV4JXG3_9BACT
MGMMTSSGLAGFLGGAVTGLDKVRERKRQEELDQRQAQRDALAEQFTRMQMDIAQQNQAMQQSKLAQLDRQRTADSYLYQHPQAVGGMMAASGDNWARGFGGGPDLTAASPEAYRWAADYQTPRQKLQDAMGLYGAKKQIDSMYPGQEKRPNFEFKKMTVDGRPGIYAINPADPSAPPRFMGGGEGGGIDINAERDLRKEFSAETNYFKQIQSSFDTIRSIAREPSAAGDIGLVFSIMKMFDPGSVVREGEFAVAQNAAGVPARVRAQYNKLISGERLTPEQRADFVGTAQRIYQDQAESFSRKKDFYSGLASQYGMSPERITYDFSGGRDGQPNADSEADRLITKYGGK